MAAAKADAKGWSPIAIGAAAAAAVAAVSGVAYWWYRRGSAKAQAKSDAKSDAAYAGLPIVLGSSSQYRQKLMREWGLPHTIRTADIDEYSVLPEGVTDVTARSRCDPQALTLAVASAKARKLMGEIKGDVVLVCSDQVVHFDGEIREKPKDRAQVHRWFAQYSAAPNGVGCCTAVVVVRTGDAAQGIAPKWYRGTALGCQRYTPVPAAVIDEMIGAKGEGLIMSCCGALMVTDAVVQPYLAAADGSADVIIGFPRDLTLSLVARAQADAKAHVQPDAQKA